MVTISVSIRFYPEFHFNQRKWKSLHLNTLNTVAYYHLGLWGDEFRIGSIVMSSISILDTLSFIVLSVIFIPFLLFFLGIVLFAYIGKTLGIQRIYVEFLVKVFEVSANHLRYCYKLIILHIPILTYLYY